MTTIGVTGGIGSGKSVVVSLLATYGYPVYLADEESKRLVDTSSVIRERLSTLLDADIYGTNGLNRRRMASLIFSNPPLLEKVNAIIHPEVARHFRAWVQRQSAAVAAALESAILFESGFDREVDWRVAVYAPRTLRLQRAMARDGVTESEILRRMANQWPDEMKTERADFVIYNDDTQPLIPQVERIISVLSLR